MDVPTSLVELSIACEGLANKDVISKSDPQCVVFMKDSFHDHFIEIGKTEVIQNSLNPNFVKKFILNYNFETIQKIKIEVWDIDEVTENDFMGSIETTLGEIVARQGNQFKRPLLKHNRNCGNIILIAEEQSSCKQVVTFQFKGMNLKRMNFFCSNDPYYTLSRVNEDNSQTIVYKSETCAATSNPIWKAKSFKLGSLNNGDYDRSLVFKCYDQREISEHKLIGSFTTSLTELNKSGGPKNFELQKNKKGKTKVNGIIGLMSISIVEKPTFVEYIQNGTELHFAVAIDFTASNGHPQDVNSLHYWNPNQLIPNQYEIALCSVGEIVQQYSNRGMFPAFGFGAKVNGVVSHQFPLNGNPAHPYCESVQQLLALYKQALTQVHLYGPTNFSPVINSTASIAQQFQDGKHYFILLIITDGIISDMPQTKAAIVAASKLPLSIIIVGVGNADFSDMDELDADEHRLCANGVYAERDIVQFVPMIKYLARNNTWVRSQADLAQEVLREIPDQAVEYFVKRGFKPNKP
ncbi:copine-8-like isoform X2 [Dinothrombium tinctorium]|uniref:Copine-8-like isoform X2 n=1 Tax=Dinothrombium tinctorium TaxID=1965070 RepID=A0A3S3RXD3_9ACAR|nr:copine-8-like isoform X2 [Dinothrombium tinctorium]